MFDFVEEHDLAIGALCVGGVLEGVEVLFEGVYCFVFLVDDLPYDTVGSAANFLNDLVPLEDVRFDFVVGLSHCRGGK